MSVHPVVHPVRATLAGILLFVIGLAIAGGAYMNYSRERERLEAWLRADGEVVQVLHLSNGASRPVIAFTAGGDRYRFTASGRLAEHRYGIGDRVAVRYPIGDPSAAVIDSPALRWASITALALLARSPVTCSCTIFGP